MSSPPFEKIRKKRLVFVGFDHGLDHSAGTQAAGAHIDGAHGTVFCLMTDSLKIGVEATLGLDVGMAHIVAHHGFLAADLTFFTHDILHKKPWRA